MPDDADFPCAREPTGSFASAPAIEPPFAIAQILDCYHDPLFVIDCDRRVLFRNVAARRVLRTRGALAEKGGRLALRPASADEALQSLVAGSCTGTGTTQAAARGIRVARSGASRDWLAVIRPLDASLVKEFDTPTFLIQVIGRIRARSAPRQVLRDLYGLSQRELAVISELLRTGSVGKSASRLSVSHETIRSHLKRIFRKCDINSQDELMSLLHRLSQFAEA